MGKVPREMFFISFSPGFNRVTTGLSDFREPFQRFTSPPANSKTVQTVRISKGCWLTRLKPGENEMKNFLTIID